MKHWELIHTEQDGPYTIELSVTPEDQALEDCFDMEPKEMEEMLSDLESGNAVHFIARVSVRVEDIPLSEEYLGSCYYPSYDEFVGDHIYNDMVGAAMTEARKRLKEIQVKMIAIDLD